MWQFKKTTTTLLTSAVFRVGKYIRVQKTTSGELNIAEVEVMGSSSPYKRNRARLSLLTQWLLKDDKGISISKVKNKTS